MAAITANAASGLWSDTSSWAGGVVPGSADTVTIPSGATITVNGTYTLGGDSASGLTIASGGTLKASRSVSSTLTLRGGAAVNGVLDWGTTSDPIPNGVTATVVGNDSASPSAGKYKITIGATGQVSFVGGVQRARNAALVSYSGSSAVVTGATNWAVGDTIVFPPSTSTDGAAGAEIVTISSMSISGAETTLTLSANLTKTHGAEWPVGNLTANVTLDFVSNTRASGIALPSGTITYPSGALVLQDAAVAYCGTPASSSAFAYAATPPASATPLDLTFTRAAFINASFVAGNTSNCVFTFNDCAVVGSTGIANALFRPANLGKIILSETSVYRYHTNAFTKLGASSNGLVSYDITGGCVAGAAANHVPFVDIGFSDFLVKSVRVQPGNNLCTPAAGSRFSFSDGCVINSTQVCSYVSGTTIIASIELTECSTGATALVNNAAFMYRDSRNYVQVVNGGGSPLDQRVVASARLVTRDNTVSKRGTSAIQIDPKASGPQTYAITFLAASGVPSRLRGAIRYNAAHGTATPPSVTISGLGITPVSYTAPAVADTWHEWELEVTQNSGGDGLLTLTMTANSTNTTTSSAWFDGVVAPPYVTRARWYGDLLQDTVPTRTADPLITYTEAAALAVAGVAIDHDAETITVTAAITAQDIWHYAIADLCQTANLSKSIHITSPDGTSFATSYTVVLSGAGSIAGRYSDANGSVVSATVTNIVAGSRILMKRTDTNAVLSNSVVAGTTFSLNIQTASAIPISVRVRKASSAPYYQEWSTTGLIDPVVGFAATANQQPDQ